MYCPKCNAPIVGKNGIHTDTGKQRWKCRNGHKTTNPVDHREAAKRQLVDEMIGDHSRTWTEDELIESLRSLKLQNPSRHITRNFFRSETQIPDSAWSHIFGTFSEFVRQAGIALNRYQHQHERHIAKHRSVDHYRKANERHSWGSDYARPSDSRIQTIVACSDLHDKDCDPFYRRVLMDTIKRCQPDIICVNGDLFDLPEFGRYTTDPRHWDVVGRIQAGHQLLREIREAAPDAQIDFQEGNHELRLVKHLMDETPAMRTLLADLHGWDTRKLLGLDEFELNYISKADLAAGGKYDIKKELAKNYKVYFDCFVAAHYPMYGKFEMAGVNGHIHDQRVWPVRTLSNGTRSWVQHGCGHKLEAGFCDAETAWQLGFSIHDVHVPSKSVQSQIISCGMIAQSGGKYYERRPDEMVGAYY